MANDTKASYITVDSQNARSSSCFPPLPSARHLKDDIHIFPMLTPKKKQGFIRGLTHAIQLS